MLGTAKAAHAHLLGQLRWLSESDSQNTELEVLSQDAVQTSAIEGEHLDLQSVRSSIARRLGLDTAGLPLPPRNVDGLVDILMDATRNHAQTLTADRLYGWHAALFPTGYSGLHKIRVAQWRGASDQEEQPMQIVSGPVGHERVHYEAPPSATLAQETQALISWCNKDSSEPLVTTALAHLWFETLHPFDDGNGRIGRALCDFLLAKADRQPKRAFSLSVQFMQNRAAYYAQLEQAQSGSIDVTYWIVWFVQQVQAACEHSEKLMERVLIKAKFWQQHQDTPINERQRKVLNLLLNSGDDFEGNMNTRKYVSLTKASRATAFRELQALVDYGCLEPVGLGRNAGYRLIPAS